LLTGSGVIGGASLGFKHVAFLLRGNGMNAADQARSLELAKTIASAAALFRAHFPDARANLTPWRDDALTRAFAEQESLDLSFHLPGWSPRSQCRSFLVQLRLDGAPGRSRPERPRLLGVTIRGLTYESERWRLATVGDWQPSGSHLPQVEVAQKLQQFSRQLFDLFSGAERGDQPLAA
jgi:hypothetical protein